LIRLNHQPLNTREWKI